MGIFDTLLETSAQPGLENLNQNALFNIGMGLLASQYNPRINPFVAAAQGLGSASKARSTAAEEQQKALERANLEKLRAGVSGMISPYAAAGHPGLQDMPGAQLTPQQRNIAGMYGQMAEFGDPSKALSGFVDFAGDAGIGDLAAGDLPKNVQEWNFYNKLSEDDQKAYLEMKRGQQIMDIAGQKVRIFGDYSEDDIISTLSEEMQAAVKTKGAGTLGTIYAKKYDLLKSSASARKENYASAQRILEKIKKKDLPTGLYRGLLYKVLPTSDQQELDALAEFAARERLKASGEIKPTDADVEGAKRALFGSNLTEEFNRRSLERLLREIESQQHEFDFISDYFSEIPQANPAAGQLSTPVPGTAEEQAGGIFETETDTVIPDTLLDATPENMLQLIEEIERL